MKWTRTKPTGPGWWWMRRTHGDMIPSQVIEIERDRYLRVYTLGRRLPRDLAEDVDCEWSSSPIPQPEEQE